MSWLDVVIVEFVVSGLSKVAIVFDCYRIRTAIGLSIVPRVPPRSNRVAHALWLIPGSPSRLLMYRLFAWEVFYATPRDASPTLSAPVSSRWPGLVG